MKIKYLSLSTRLNEICVLIVYYNLCNSNNTDNYCPDKTMLFNFD